jgi:PAS domain S-box-containing protein
MTGLAGKQPGDASEASLVESREEVLYHSGRTRIVRLHAADGATYVRKERWGPGSVYRLRREAAILQRLLGVSGVPRLATAPAPPGSILLEDADAESLVSVLAGAPMGTPELLTMARRLASILVAVHAAAVVHKDINPANILVTRGAGEPMLIDFDLATTFAEDRPAFAHESQVAGTLAYLAPEQSGRTGQPVDERADLYALGATLYELATGAPPFGNGDALTLIHDHLARVPAAPATVNSAVPRSISDVIMRLLEKEPDRRYQTAAGLTADLSRIERAWAAGDALPFALGERDFSLRLAPPARVVGRDREIAVLREAFARAQVGTGRGVLIAGPSGVGKTALIDQLRPIVTASGGWLVAGKFDQYRQDLETDGVAQALRGLGRLLLAEPEGSLQTLRPRLRDAVGPNAGLIALLSHEFAQLLDATPETVAGDPLEVGARTFRAALDLLRVVASPARPLVMVVDDLQWAGSTPIGFLDAVLTDDSLRGLLLVGAYRDTEVDAAHPLTAMISRWERLGVAPAVVRLGNLPTGDLGTLLREMLRLQPADAAHLAQAIGARTDGNPFDTVELVNALRRDGALVLGEHGWVWDPSAIRRFVGSSDVEDLLSERIVRLPEPTQAIVDVMACLGGDMGLDLLQAATGLSGTTLDEHLMPALEDGLLVMEGDEKASERSLRFRHDRVQQAAYGRIAPDPRRAAHLELARRLAQRPDLAGVSAAQYLRALAEVTDAGERRRVAVLFGAAAATVRLTDPELAERYLSTAISLLPQIGTAADDPLAVSLEIDLHAVLYSLGRLDEADACYALVQRRCPDPEQLAESACVQIDSLTIRGRPREAVALGMGLLVQLGVAVGGDLYAVAQRRMPELVAWASTLNLGDDLARPESDQRRVRMLARIINRLEPAAFFCEPELFAWLLLENRQQWVEHGPSAPLVANLGPAIVATIMLSGDYRTGYAIGRHALAVGEARGYEPETSYARHAFSKMAAHWFEPLEVSIDQARRAREGAIQGGDLQMACFTYFTSAAALLDCAPTLESCAVDIEAALAFADRTGNDHSAGSFVAYRQLLAALRGETRSAGSFADDSFDESAHLSRLEHNPMSRAYFHICRALAASLFDDAPSLAHHAQAAAGLLPFIVSFYPIALAYLLQSLALADRAKVAATDERAAVLAELDTCRNWLAERAATAPGNFEHLVRLVDAERAWATGDAWSAAQAYDAARRDVATRQRPWHHALIAERAGRFYLHNGLLHTAGELLAEARDHYAAWGATAKVRHLEAEISLPRLASVSAASRGSTVSASASAIDMLAILTASQALSSETNLGRLRSRMRDVLGAMSGASDVGIVLRGDRADDWRLYTSGDEHEIDLPVEDAAAQGLLAISAFRYTERTRAPLLVADATQDDRFMGDPYFAGVQRCSLLTVPVLSQGVLQAVVLLENRLSRGAFTTDRLDAVMLIAGQLAVCFDNALAERFRSLVQRSSDLTLVCDRDGMLTYVSAASADLLGIDDAALTGQAVAELVRPDDRAALNERIRQPQRPGVEPMKCQALHADGSQRGVEITFTDLSQDPAVRGVMLHLRDVTERHRLEAELHHAQKLESVGRLAAGIAHEINTPIQFISDNVRFLQGAFTDLLRLRQAESAVSAAGDEAAQHLARAHAQTVAADIDVDFLVAEIPDAFDQTLEGTTRVATIVRAMKAFGYATNDEKNPADLNEAIANTLVIATSELTDVTDVETYYAELPPVWCYVGDINQVVLNLVINAAHAIRSADRGRGVVTVATRLADDQVLIEITDTGTGIPADTAEKIFEPFFTTKEVGAGTGQGLALSRSLIVDRHGGSITFATEPGVGTTFTVRLPCRVEPPAS